MIAILMDIDCQPTVSIPVKHVEKMERSFMLVKVENWYVVAFPNRSILYSCKQHSTV